MSKKIQLTIPTPCHEDWDNMLPVEKGKFCQSCSREVIDFSNMSDSQLVAFFKKPSTGSVCGRFMDDQLGRQIIEPRKKLPWIKYFFQFTLPAFLISSRAYTQGEVKGKIATVVAVNEVKGDPVLVNSIKQTAGKTTINGFVKDEKGSPVPYASLQVKGTKNGVVADSTGRFSIKTEKDNELMTLIISSVGFEQREETVNLSDSDCCDLLVTLKVKSLGEVAVIANTTTKGGVRIRVGATSVIHCTRNIINDSFTVFSPKFSLYPNPVAAGQSITIVNRKLQEDDYSFEIVNISGQTIHKKQISITEQQKITVSTPFVVPGTYFVKLIGRKKLKAYTEKIIIK